MGSIKAGTTELASGETVVKQARGFAVIKQRDPARQAEIASMGGKAAHQSGTAHEWTKEEARKAGRKGGLAKKSRLIEPK